MKNPLVQLALAFTLSLCTACGGGGSDAPVSDVGRYALDVEATFTLHDVNSAQTPEERVGLVRANAQATNAGAHPLFGLTLQEDGAFVLTLGSAEEARGSWVRSDGEIKLVTTTFDGVAVEPPEASSVRVLGAGKLAFTAGGVNVQLIRQ